MKTTLNVHLNRSNFLCESKVFINARKFCSCINKNSFSKGPLKYNNVRHFGGISEKLIFIKKKIKESMLQYSPELENLFDKYGVKVRFWRNYPTNIDMPWYGNLLLEYWRKRTNERGVLAQWQQVTEFRKECYAPLDTATILREVALRKESQKTVLNNINNFYFKGHFSEESKNSFESTLLHWDVISRDFVTFLQQRPREFLTGLYKKQEDGYPILSLDKTVNVLDPLTFMQRYYTRVRLNPIEKEAPNRWDLLNRILNRVVDDNPFGPNVGGWELFCDLKNYDHNRFEIVPGLIEGIPSVKAWEQLFLEFYKASAEHAAEPLMNLTTCIYISNINGAHNIFPTTFVLKLTIGDALEAARDVSDKILSGEFPVSFSQAFAYEAHRLILESYVFFGKAQDIYLTNAKELFYDLEAFLYVWILTILLIVMSISFTAVLLITVWNIKIFVNFRKFLWSKLMKIFIK